VTKVLCPLAAKGQVALKVPRRDMQDETCSVKNTTCNLQHRTRAHATSDVQRGPSTKPKIRCLYTLLVLLGRSLESHSIGMRPIHACLRSVLRLHRCNAGTSTGTSGRTERTHLRLRLTELFGLQQHA
jgi:hypothetical protein